MPQNASLNKEQLQYLRGLCHHLNPVVMVAAKGLSENVINELETALNHHELIKVKIRAEREERKALIEEMVNLTQANLIQTIGQTACLFRRNANQPRIALPG